MTYGDYAAKMIRGGCGNPCSPSNPRLRGDAQAWQILTLRFGGSHSTELAELSQAMRAGRLRRGLCDNLGIPHHW